MALIVSLMLGAASLMDKPVGEFFVKSGECVKGLLDGDLCSGDEDNKSQNPKPTEVAGLWKWVYEGGKWILKKVIPKSKPKVTPTPKQIEKFKKMLEQHGIKALEKSRKTIQRRLEEHRKKLEQLKK